MIEIIREAADLRSLASSWNELAEPFRTPLLRYEWLAACAEAFCPPGLLRIVVLTSRGKVRAIAPLVLVRRRGVARLEFLGASFLFEAGGFIYADREALRELEVAIVRVRRPLLLNRLEPESLEALMLQETCRRRALLVLRKAQASPWLPITNGWTEFEATLSASRRASLRRGRSRADKMGPVQFEILAPSPGSLPHHLEDALRVEAAGWKGKKRTAISSSAHLTSFFSAYSRYATDLGIFRLCFLRIGGRTVAVQLAVQYAKRFWVLKSGYDEAWARCSPGMLLMHETIRHAFENKLEAFEFLGDDEPWIRVWTDHVRAQVSARIYPFSLKGMFGFGLDVSRVVLDRTMEMSGVQEG